MSWRALDAEFFQDRRKRKSNMALPPEEAIQASNEIQDYLENLIHEKKRVADSGSDLISRLLRDHVIPGHMSHKQCLGTLQLLLEAGHETTGSMIALGTLSLLLNPEQKDALVANPELVPGAVEEMLRFHTPTHLSGVRAALQDIEIKDTHIPQGHGVLCMLGAANRDPEVFQNPDAFDINRDARHHVAFSYGIHQCLGQFLARLELQTVFTKLFQRFPNLRLAVPLEELEFRSESIVYGINTLPVEW